MVELKKENVRFQSSIYDWPVGNAAGFYRMFDVPQEHCCFQIIQDARKYYFMYKNNEKSPFTREHAHLLKEIRFNVGKPPVKKPPAKKLQSMKFGYALRCQMISPVPPLPPVVPV